MGFTIPDIKRWWLHQANINMNDMITKRLLGQPANNSGIQSKVMLWVMAKPPRLKAAGST